MADTKSKAQRLADALDAWDGKLMMPKGWREATAAELRRLDAVEAERGVLLHAVKKWRDLADRQSARLAAIEAELDRVRQSPR